ncbi:hypothetical protein CRI70_02620 [Streptomyces sp. Ru87]|nr:hypothetical protein CRI70_02620 [Streptomyces sp. Ru87]
MAVPRPRRSAQRRTRASLPRRAQRCRAGPSARAPARSGGEICRTPAGGRHERRGRRVAAGRSRVASPEPDTPVRARHRLVRQRRITNVPPTAPNPPIYQDLVDEHGDVLAELRRVMEETRNAAAEALDWSDMRDPATPPPGT